MLEILCSSEMESETSQMIHGKRESLFLMRNVEIKQNALITVKVSFVVVVVIYL